MGEWGNGVALGRYALDINSNTVRGNTSSSTGYGHKIEGRKMLFALLLRVVLPEYWMCLCACRGQREIESEGARERVRKPECIRQCCVTSDRHQAKYACVLTKLLL